MMFIYVITNKVTSKIYIGQHKGANLRQYLQKKFYWARVQKTGSSYLFNAMRKHPYPADWSIEPLMELETKEELDRLETLLIALYDTRNPEVGYNICKGGEGRTEKGWHHKPETIKKITDANMGRQLYPRTPENEAIRIAAWQKYVDDKIASGEYHTPETLEKLKAVRANQDEALRLEAYRRFESEHGTERRKRAAETHRGTKHKMSSTGSIKVSDTFKRIAHNRWHVSRNIKSSTCQLCIEAL